MKEGDLREKSSQKKMFSFLFPSLDKINVGNSYLTRKFTCETSFRSRVWGWTRMENSTGIKLGSRSHTGTGHNCWHKDLMDLLVRSTRRKAVATQSFFHCLFKTRFFCLRCCCFVMHSFTMSPGDLWLSLMFLGVSYTNRSERFCCCFYLCLGKRFSINLAHWTWKNLRPLPLLSQQALITSECLTDLLLFFPPTAKPQCMCSITCMWN